MTGPGSHHLVRDVEYRHGDTRMIGYVCPAVDRPAAADRGDLAARDTMGVLLIHDAFGASQDMLLIARQLADRGHPVFVADLWGERRVPRTESEVGPLIGHMVSHRDQWLARIRAAHDALTEQPEFLDRPITLLGYCFGGSSALEYLRTGARVAGVAGIHAGLDVLGHDWTSPGSARVLLCTGADDPMASAEMRRELQAGLSSAGLDWQLHLYGGTKHAFTSPKAADSRMPDVVAYNPLSAARSWATTLGFLRELADGLTHGDTPCEHHREHSEKDLHA